jgi:hypothetical protein
MGRHYSTEVGSPTGTRKNDHRTEASSNHCQRAVKIAQLCTSVSFSAASVGEINISFAYQRNRQITIRLRQTIIARSAMPSGIRSTASPN